MKPLALVVENDGGTRKLLDVLLTRIGLEVDLVPTGSDALVVLEKVSYDLVFIDLMLRGTSGREVLSWIAGTRPELLARTVVLSSAPPAQVAALRDLWPDLRIISKPFELGEIMETALAITASREPHTPDAGETFCRLSIRAGAKAGVVTRLDGDEAHPVLTFGYPADVVGQFFPLPVDAPFPLSISMRQGKPVWIASVVMATPQYPLLAPVWDRSESRAIAALPIIEDNRVVGAVEWSFREPRLFGEAEQRTFASIAGALPSLLLEESSAERAPA